MTSIPDKTGFVSRFLGCTRRPEDDTPHEHRRRHILGAAKACFARSGFHGASMQEICAQAQMSPGAIYRYFRSKDEMIEAIADDERARNAELIGGLQASEGGTVDRLMAVGMRYLSEMREPGAAALMAEVCSEALRNSAVGERFRRNEREVRHQLLAFLQGLAESGEIDPHEDIDAVLDFLAAVIDGLVIRAGIDPTLSLDRIEPMLRAVSVCLLRPKAGDPTTDRKSDE